MAITDIVTLPFGDPFGHFATNETTPQWLADVRVDLSDYDNARFALSLSATIKAAGGAIPTFSVVKQGDYAATVVALTPTASPADWAAEMASAARVVGRGLTTFSLYGVAAGGLSPTYYLRGSGGVAPTALSRSANVAEDAYAIALTTSPVSLGTPITPVGDPNLAILSSGTYCFTFWAYSTGNICDIAGTLFYGPLMDHTVTHVNSLGYVPIAIGTVLTAYQFYATVPTDINVGAGQLKLSLGARSTTGSGTLTLGLGGSHASNLTVPWVTPGIVEINAAALTLEFGDVDPPPRRPPPGPVGGDDIWLGEVD